MESLCIHIESLEPVQNEFHLFIYFSWTISVNNKWRNEKMYLIPPIEFRNVYSIWM